MKYDSKFSPDRDSYERDLRRRQEEHMKNVQGGCRPWQPCMHDSCSECVGTGTKQNGQRCIHAMSCPCPKCTPTYM